MFNNREFKLAYAQMAQWDNQENSESFLYYRRRLVIAVAKIKARRLVTTEAKIKGLEEVQQMMGEHHKEQNLF